ncbi:MAG: 2-C-methyl-D-erythritol 2,4-cyclodiphosphate synthase [Muribaculaceae bacterium]|nr:2-C-methyl-D-erythritol 2,4-cyclodiphosphate synthase [Muribaculaceae bacterium]
MMRIGQGYDVHRLAEGRELWLGGIKIEHSKGLDGHSDADVAIHALCDALLGALALGDIGKHFPDTDERFKGIDSKKLLAATIGLITDKGYHVVNADLTIMAQKPKLAPHIDDMRQTLATIMNVDSDAVSVKATTTERLGFEGREEGISALAIVLVDNRH